MGLTITEALAEIKTIQARIEKKHEFVKGFLVRQDTLRDPHEKNGGSFETIRRERQAIGDLEERILHLRRAIADANAGTVITINGVARPISEWLTWRRDVAPGHKDFLREIRQVLSTARAVAQKQSLSVVASGQQTQHATDIIVNVDEHQLAQEIETMEDTLGQLDGLLSLKNATVSIE